MLRHGLDRCNSRMSLPARLLAMMMVSTAGCASGAADTTPASGQFLKREVTVDGGVHRYQVFVPARHGLGKTGGTHGQAPVPVILFLHGSGERGEDGEKQVHSGLGPHVRANAADFPALVVFPQSPEGQSWEGQTARVALATLEASVREFDGDPRRVYLTGMSRGGYGTYSLALDHPTHFAALVPVCGGITSPRREEPLVVGPLAGEPDPFQAAARRLAHLPIWIFHGALDDVVPPQQSRRMHAALEAAGGNARYTELPDANHNSWDAAYSDDAMWAWLFAQHRPSRP